MQTKEELRDILNRHFGEASVRALEDGGRLVLADSLEAATDYLQDVDFFSKINTEILTIAAQSGRLLVVFFDVEKNQFDVLKNYAVNNDVTCVELAGPQSSRPQALVQGFYSRKNRRAFLIADALDDVSAPAVLLHEIGVHMAYDVECRDDMQKLADQASQILAEAAICQDPVALRVEARLTEAKIFDGAPNYALATCAYLVEESFKAAQPSNLTGYWLSQIKYGIKTWLYNIGFCDIARLTHQELLLIAQGNVETLSHDPVLQRKVFHPTEEDSLDWLQWFLEKRLGQASVQAVMQIVRDLSKKREVPEETEEVKTSRRMF